MKKIIFILVTLFIISCDKAKPNFATLVNDCIILNKLETPITVHKTKKNQHLGDSKYINLLSTKELLDKKNEKFYSLSFQDYKDSIAVYLSNYNSGKDYTTTFDKNQEYKVLHNGYIQTKRAESKPYYIYWAIMKEKYPKYMNWNDFKIPADSLR